MDEILEGRRKFLSLSSTSHYSGPYCVQSTMNAVRFACSVISFLTAFWVTGVPTAAGARTTAASSTVVGRVPDSLVGTTAIVVERFHRAVIWGREIGLLAGEDELV